MTKFGNNASYYSTPECYVNVISCNKIVLEFLTNISFLSFVCILLRKYNLGGQINKCSKNELIGGILLGFKFCLIIILIYLHSIEYGNMLLIANKVFFEVIETDECLKVWEADFLNKYCFLIFDPLLLGTLLVFYFRDKIPV